MKRWMVVGIVVMDLACAFAPTIAGPTRAALPAQTPTRHPAAVSSFKPNRPLPFRRHPRGATVIIFPDTAGYLLPPRAVVSSPYFCLYHNEAFVSRIGMIDHLSGMHELPLTTAASICPDANGECVFPSY